MYLRCNFRGNFQDGTTTFGPYRILTDAFSNPTGYIARPPLDPTTKKHISLFLIGHRGQLDEDEIEYLNHVAEDEC